MLTAVILVYAAFILGWAQMPWQSPSYAFEKSDSQRTTLNACIDNTDGNDETCLLPGSKTSCRSLKRVASAVANMSSVSQVEIIIHGGLELKESITFKGLPVVRLVGSQASKITCSPSNDSSAGLVFTAIQNITIENLTFSQCGAFQNYANSSTETKKQFKAAVHIRSPTNVLVNQVTLSSSNGAGLSVTDVRGGTVVISNSMFDNNVMEYQTEYEGGGGIFVWLWQHHENFNEFFINNCWFLNNRAITIKKYDFIANFGSALPGSGLGGGIRILLTNSAASNKISISACKFMRNLAYIGGGLAIKVKENSRNNFILVENSTFEQNGCQEEAQSGSGGGANFGFHMNQFLSNNTISVENTNFIENCAEVGGGIVVFSSRSEHSDINSSVTFQNCNWIANNARLGAAVDISPSAYDRLTRGFFPTPIFTNCEFISNTVTVRTHDQIQYTFGTGTFFSSLFDITFQSSAKFVNNSGSAFIIVNGIADFSSCNATFINNTGMQGGAIALIGGSSMIVGPQCNYTFIQNNATDQGGAIYARMIDEHDFYLSSSCFIQYSENLHRNSLIPFLNWTSTFNFKDNFALRHGHSIFATSFVPCQQKLHGILSDISTADQIKYQLSTEGAKFNITSTLPFLVIPGRMHLLEVELLDDVDQKVDTPIRASIVNEDDSRLEDDDVFSCITGNAIRLLGDEGERGHLLLQSITNRKNSIIVNVTLLQCPTGYILSKSNRKCVCDAHSYVGIVYCNYTEFQVHLEEGFWAGYIKNEGNTSELTTSLCPEGFCSYGNKLIRNRIVKLPQSTAPSKLDKTVCGPTRTGILCGSCTAGHTVYYNSHNYRCKKSTRICKLGWLFYVLSELVPVTILFIIVLAFNISFTSGSINGFILFSQILDTLYLYGSGVFKVPHQGIKIISRGYSVIYGFFSLHVDPVSFCLLKNATALDILAFKYVTIAYSFVLILSVILFMRHCAPRLLGRHFKLSVIKNSVIHGLSTFIVVCYAQCINVSLSILLPQPLRGRGGHPLYPGRVWFNGDMVVFSKEHLPYAIPALLFLIIVGVIFPTLLVAYPLVNRLLAFCGIGESHAVMSLSERVHISKLKPFIDTFQGCFKDNLRFFAGFYFLYRWIGPLAYAASGVSLSGYYALVEAILIIMLVVHAVAQPYVIQWHNIVDALLLGDLAVINGLTSLAYFYSRTGRTLENKKSINIAVTIQLIFIYLPILFYVAAFILIVCNKFCFQKLMNSRKRQSENENLTNSNQRNASASISLEEFPARVLGDDVEYEKFPSEFSRSPTPESDTY